MVDVQAGASGTASPAHRSRSFVALREPPLGARLAEEARLLLGLTNSAFAREFGVSGPYLSLIRRGQRRLPPQLVQRIGPTAGGRRGMRARAGYGRPHLPEPLRAQLVEALARLLVADLEHYPALPAVDQVDTAPEGTAR